mmetsp:Transcript_20046/g.34500  ORF Transcript_20046/g.34500 Transcript_20046/m.34500 type:complete len:283 (+) Transcript_20046:226-1074(+)
MSQLEIKSLYNENAMVYEDLKAKEWRMDIEKYSLMKHILVDENNLRGKKVLDLGCGDGVYSREASRLGAELVVGIDISEEMIKLSKERTASFKSNIHFFVADCSNLDQVKAVLQPLGCDPNSFDVIIASWLIVYSKTKEQLNGFASVFEHYLNPSGGRLVGINVNPLFYHYDEPALFVKYGFVGRINVPLRTGDRMCFDFLDSTITEDTSQDHVAMTIINYHSSRAELIESFGSHHMDLKLEKIECDPAVLNDRGDYYETILSEQPFAILDAVKQMNLTSGA